MPLWTSARGDSRQDTKNPDRSVGVEGRYADLNRRPTHYECVALPAELYRQILRSGRQRYAGDFKKFQSVRLRSGRDQVQRPARLRCSAIWTVLVAAPSAGCPPQPKGAGRADGSSRDAIVLKHLVLAMGIPWHRSPRFPVCPPGSRPGRTTAHHAPHPSPSPLQTPSTRPPVSTHHGHAHRARQLDGVTHDFLRLVDLHLLTRVPVLLERVAVRKAVLVDRVRVTPQGLPLHDVQPRVGPRRQPVPVTLWRCSPRRA